MINQTTEQRMKSFSRWQLAGFFFVGVLLFPVLIVRRLLMPNNEP